MIAIFLLLQLAFMVVLYAALAKLAARLLRRTQLSWKHSFAYGAIAVLAGTIGTVIHQSLGGVLPLPVALALGIGMQLGIGGWFLGSRALTASGEQVGFKGGVLLSLVATGIILAFGILAGVVIPMLADRAVQA